MPGEGLAMGAGFGLVLLAETKQTEGMSVGEWNFISTGRTVLRRGPRGYKRQRGKRGHPLLNTPPISGDVKAK